MPILARTQESCRDILPFCNPVPIGPGPALNAASADGSTVDFEGIPLPDPSERNPNAALSKYMSETRPELVLGVVLIVAIAVIGVVLWVKYDAKARARLGRCWASLRDRFLRSRKVDTPRLTISEPPSPGAQSDLTRVSTRVDEPNEHSSSKSMRMATEQRPTLERAPVDESKVSTMKTEQVTVLPKLLSQP
jgi:hypothetical protein